MPRIYLSPSTQEYNLYAGGGNEEQYMNQIADAMVPYLLASGIQFSRNTPDMTASSSIAASNAGNYDLHLALHSNASSTGQARGSEVYFYPTSERSQRAAQIIANNLKLIYPDPQLVRTVETTSLGEVARTRAPAVLIEFAFHDNPDDAAWIRENIDAIAENVVLSLTDYFDIPFLKPQAPISARVRTPGGGPLNLRARPSLDAEIIGQIPNGAAVTIYGDDLDWYVVGFQSRVGYAASEFIEPL